MAKMHKVMARKSVRLTGGDQYRNGQPAREGAYAAPGRNSAVFYVTKERLDELLAQNAIHLLEGEAPKKEVPADDPPPKNNLPLEFPYRDKLWAAGLKTRSAVRDYPDLTEITGIGKTYADRILKALDELEAAEG